MFTGIDIGGTNTDIAVIRDNNIETVKVANDAGISSALSKVSIGGRLAISTSQPLNRLIMSSPEELCTITIPGPGIVRPGAVRGAVTIRGDVAEEIDPDEVREIFEGTDADYLAVAGKFSVRNPALEERVREIALGFFDEKRIALSYYIGEIGFPSRIATTKINAQVREVVLGVGDIVNAHFLGREFYFMKGDGGLSSPEIVYNNPSVLYNSSQTAVVLGTGYLTGIKDALVIDIGGTTTDFVPMKGGMPEEEELDFGGGHTGIRGIRSLSLPYGGDSLVDGGLLPFRKGAPRAFGGRSFTLTDALNVCGYEIGDYKSSGYVNRSVADMVVSDYFEKVENAISVFSPDLIIGAGYLAPLLMPEIAGVTGIEVLIPEHAGSANAVGVAVSRVSISLNVRYDSEKGRMIVNGEMRRPERRYSDDDLIEECTLELKRTAMEMGSPKEDCEDVVIRNFRAYDVVRNKERAGRIVDLCIAIPPGISSEAL
ncbi:hydantoinase/oxoprolinase family protein [Methanoplanus limicola]|uniref:Hydantoinase/oxoprolinase n=1 Tax=Methanoplanus limicola DSM 2279 TaxID=937775 RepID=H1YZI9_9EURY|nr:hydantoinase/oxoprolinase family protein [Methanoplanus limicola]EHQ36098.1 Hydantoinase/oxoprolinase [Methanoplanus limicola DSM 2279]